MSVCGFCHDRPVLNAAAWVALDEPRYLACPRCGRFRVYDGDGQPVESERETS